MDRTVDLRVPTCAAYTPSALQPLCDQGNLRSSSNLESVGEWAIQFIEQLDWNTVFSVLHGADFMQISDLVDIAAARIASRICQWSKAQKDSAFVLPRELTPEEERLLREGSKWAEEEDSVDGSAAAGTTA